MSASTSTNGKKGLHIALWVAQALLAALFLMTGFMKLTAPTEQLAAQMKWMAGVFGPMVRFIALSEILGALGILLPSLLRFLPKVSALAAAGLAVVMILATGTHLSYGEYPNAVFTLIFAGLGLFVAWGRWKGAPIQPR